MASFKPLPVTDIQQWKVARAKKRKKVVKKAKENQDDIELSNSYSALSDTEFDTSAESTDRVDKMDGIENTQATVSGVKKNKIPPLVIYTFIANHVKTIRDMEKDLMDKLSLVCKRDRVIIYCKNEQDYRVMREKIAAAQVEHHTYSLNSEKPVISILKGLPPNVTELEIKEELEQEHNLKVIEVKQFVKKK